MKEMHTWPEIQPAEMYRYPRTLEQAFGPHSSMTLLDLEEDLIDPPWTLLDFVLIVVFFVGGLILAGYVAAKVGIV